MVVKGNIDSHLALASGLSFQGLSFTLGYGQRSDGALLKAPAPANQSPTNGITNYDLIKSYTYRKV